MANIKLILAPVDFSNCSEQALRHATSLAAKLNANVCLLHVYQPPFYAPSPQLVHVAPEITKEHREATKKELLKLAQSSQVPGVQISTEFVDGIPHDAIAHTAERTHADLIVIGTHGRTGLNRLLLGSVAERVARTSRIPVLIVPSARDVT